jgi:hypothetical protein
MSKLLAPKVRESEEAVKGLPRGVREAVSNVPELPRPEPVAASPIAAGSSSPRRSEDLIEAAEAVAKEIDACWEFSERLEIYIDVGRCFKSDARRVLNIAAARWPKLIFWVNDMPEWKALLSADLS